MFSLKSQTAFALGLILGGTLGFGLTYHFSSTEDPTVTSKAPIQRHAIKSTESTPSPAPLKRSTSWGQSHLKDNLAELLASNEPTLRAAKLIELGMRAAAGDFEQAMRSLASIQDPTAREAFMRGIFAQVAQTQNAYSAVMRVRRLERALETEAYRVLISEWTGRGVPSQAGLRDLASILMRDQSVPEAIKRDWIKAFEKHANRSEMLGEFGASLVSADPEAALAVGDHLDAWERRRFLDRLATTWAATDSESAWAWAQENMAELDPETVAVMLGAWWQRAEDRGDVDQAFARLEDPEVRVEAAAYLASLHASQSGTREAVAWADSLPNEMERDAAHERIYEETPRGIGAVLGPNDGMISVANVLEGTPAHEAGLRQGDRIVEVDPGNGRFQSVDYENLQGAIEHIRGEAGSPLRLRILRTRNGEAQEQVIDLNRQQLILPGSDELFDR